MVRTEELGFTSMTFLFLSPWSSSISQWCQTMFNLLSAVLNHKKQSEIIITTSSWALDLPSRGYHPAGKPHFSEINPLMLIWQQHKEKSKPTFLVFLSHLSHQWCWQSRCVRSICRTLDLWKYTRVPFIKTCVSWLVYL